MYEELYKIWKREKEKDTLEELSQDFYVKVADYLMRIKEETRMIDKKTLKASLLYIEMQNAKRMLRELLQTRNEKIVKNAFKGEKISPNFLTNEERNMFQKISSILENIQEFMRQILEGRRLAISAEHESKMAVLRFLRDVPAIVGQDIKVYGPFKAEEVACVTIENAKILIKQGLAEKINVD
ncbi:MAG: hypothetical protein QXH37_08590 [Candidatus Bathyarchaeia archaeon]